MKNEDRIVELLSESLRKQDRHEEILVNQGTLLKKMVEGLDQLNGQFLKMNDHLLTKQDKMEDRLSRLEDHVFGRKP
ncbi:MAG: hypothetical protein RIF33_21390 [Cyclobacteriaceae bacterium]